MGLEELVPLAALVGIVALFWYFARRVGRQDSASPATPEPEAVRAKDREVELRFANVFAMLTEPRREGLISHYREAEGVTRVRAMERACEDWEKHNRLPN